MIENGFRKIIFCCARNTRFVAVTAQRTSMMVVRSSSQQASRIALKPTRVQKPSAITLEGIDNTPDDRGRDRIRSEDALDARDDLRCVVLAIGLPEHAG